MKQEIEQFFLPRSPFGTLAGITGLTAVLIVGDYIWVTHNADGWLQTDGSWVTCLLFPPGIAIALGLLAFIVLKIWGIRTAMLLAGVVAAIPILGMSYAMWV